MAEKTEMNQYNVLILDILHLVYRGVRPKDLVKDQARVSSAYRCECDADTLGTNGSISNTTGSREKDESARIKEPVYSAFTFRDYHQGSGCKLAPSHPNLANESG